MDRERITHAAIKYENQEIVLASRHGQIIKRQGQRGVITAKTAHVQGFWTSRDRFVGREAAARIATRAGQVNEPKTYLFSEDCLPYIPE